MTYTFIHNGTLIDGWGAEAGGTMPEWGIHIERMGQGCGSGNFWVR